MTTKDRFRPDFRPLRETFLEVTLGQRGARTTAAYWPQTATRLTGYRVHGVATDVELNEFRTGNVENLVSAFPLAQGNDAQLDLSIVEPGACVALMLTHKGEGARAFRIELVGRELLPPDKWEDCPKLAPCFSCHMPLELHSATPPHTFTEDGDAQERCAAFLWRPYGTLNRTEPGSRIQRYFFGIQCEIRSWSVAQPVELRGASGPDILMTMERILTNVPDGGLVNFDYLQIGNTITELGGCDGAYLPARLYRPVNAGPDTPVVLRGRTTGRGDSIATLGGKPFLLCATLSGPARTA